MNLLKKVIGCLSFMALSTPSAALYGKDVELLLAERIQMSRYAIEWTTTQFEVLVEANGADHAVTVVQQVQEDEWIEFPLYFDGYAGQGKEIWRGQHQVDDLGDFAIRLKSEGEIFWDNNSGENYQFNGDGYILGQRKNVHLQSLNRYEIALEGESKKVRLNLSIVVRNLDPSKDLKVVYSTDDWQTSTAVNAQFSGPNVLIGYGSFPNPSLNGTERWNVFFDVEPNVKGSFFLEYSANYATYFDTNETRNYPFKFDSYFETVFVQSGPRWENGFPMTLIDDNLWSAPLRVNSSEEQSFKFDIFNDWVLNYGDNDGDGLAERNGNNILVSKPGDYRVYFNDLEKTYRVVPLVVQ